MSDTSLGRAIAQIGHDSGKMLVRASSAAECRRKLVYAARGTTAAEHTPEQLVILESGVALQSVVLRNLQRKGWNALDAGEQFVEYELAPGLVVTGHPDGFIDVYDGITGILEIKTRSTEAHNRWRDLGAEISHPSAVWQAAIYTYAVFGEPRPAVIATMDVGNRSIGQPEIIPAERVAHALEQVKAWLAPLASQSVRITDSGERDKHGNVEAVRNRWLRGPEDEIEPELPPRDFRRSTYQCKGCAYNELCRPQVGTADLPEQAASYTREHAEAALNEYEIAEAKLGGMKDAIKEATVQKKDAAAILRDWMHESSFDAVEMQAGIAPLRRIKLVISRRTKVDHKALNELLSPEQRETIYSETKSMYVRVS